MAMRESHEVLSSMGVMFEPFQGEYDCDLLFVNCGTTDRLDSASLQRFVQAGGCLYASDLTSSLICDAFPGMFRFCGSGNASMVAAYVIDGELRQVVGYSTTVHFDMESWAILEGCQGETLVEAARGTAYAGRPLMVEVEWGNGATWLEVTTWLEVKVCLPGWAAALGSGRFPGLALRCRRAALWPGRLGR
jgi:hypothetical protein